MKRAFCSKGNSALAFTVSVFGKAIRGEGGESGSFTFWGIGLVNGSLSS